MRKLTLAILICLICCTARAQYAVYGTVGGLKSDVAGDGWTGAGTFGLYHQARVAQVAGFGYDARLTFSDQLSSFLVGPRVAASPRVLPIKPYAEALLGVGWHRQFGSTDKDFAYELVGGVDHAILPQVDWRVIEFSFGGLGALDSGVHPKTISTGLALRF